MTDLINRLEAGEGSRELDAELWDLVDDRPRIDLDGDGPIWKRYPDDDVAYDGPPRFTASVDAAMSLADEALPGWIVSLDGLDKGLWYGSVSMPTRTSHTTGGYFYARSPTPALALCIAILKARASVDQPGSGDKNGR